MKPDVQILSGGFFSFIFKYSSLLQKKVYSCDYTYKEIFGGKKNLPLKEFQYIS